MLLYHSFKTRKKVDQFFFVVIISFARAQASLYSFGVANGDTELPVSTWNEQSSRIDLASSVPLFGRNTITKIWVLYHFKTV